MPNDPSQIMDGSISLPETSGSTIISIYGERKVKVFAIHEPELDTMSYLNTAAIACFSMGSFLLSNFVLGSGVANSPPTQSLWVNPSAWATAFFFIAGIGAIVVKGGICNKIKTQSQTKLQ